MKPTGILALVLLAISPLAAQDEVELRARQQKYAHELGELFPDLRDTTKGWGRDTMAALEELTRNNDARIYRGDAPVIAATYGYIQAIKDATGAEKQRLKEIAPKLVAAGERIKKLEENLSVKR